MSADLKLKFLAALDAGDKVVCLDLYAAALSERDVAYDEASYAEQAFKSCEKSGMEWQARANEAEGSVTALEKALEGFAQRIDNDGTASQIVSADEIRALLSAKGGET
jgi:hypothetical protein